MNTDKKKFNLGEVGFGRPSTRNAAGWEYASFIGEERTDLLQLVYDGKELPDDLFLIGQIPGGFRKITPDEIDRDYMDYYFKPGMPGYERKKR